MFFNIPPDIIEEIISHFPHDNHKDIRNLALVSRTFLDPCQRHLFMQLELTLSLSVDDGTFTRLREVFKNDPHLAYYVKALFVTLPRDVAFRSGPNWIDEHPSTFAEILDSLSSSPIHTITLRKLPNPPCPEWNQLPPEVQRAFHRIFAKPSVHTLQVVSLTIPKTFFKEFGGLENLELFNTLWAEESLEIQSGSDSERVQRLKSIKTGGLGLPGKCLDLHTMIPERGLDLSDVDRAVWWITLSSRVEYSFSTLNAAKLKFLEVGLSNVRAESGTNTTRPLDLSSCRSLSQLTFSDQGSLYGPTSCNSSWIAATLSSLPLRHCIQNLVIRSSVAPSLQSLSPALSRLHSHSDDVKVSIQVPGLRDTVDDYQRERVARLKDQIYNLVKWEGCESVLQVRDWS